MKLLSLFVLLLLLSCNEKKPTEITTKESHLGLLWSYDTQNVSAPFAEPLIENNHLFITGGLALHKIKYSDGSRVWYSPTQGTASVLQNARFIHNEQTVISLKPNFIVGFSKENGTIQWETQIADSLYLLDIGMGAKFNESAFYTSTLGYIFDVNINPT